MKAVSADVKSEADDGQPGVAGLRWHALLLALLLILTTGVVIVTGMRPAVPVAFAILIVVIGLPFAACLTWLAKREQTRGTVAWAWCIALAMGILATWHHPLVWPLLALALTGLPATGLRVSRWNVVLLAAVALFCGYGIVWNANYALERLLPVRRWDPEMRAFDLWLYRQWSGGEVDLTAAFPIAVHPWLLRAFDNAYTLLLSEVLVVTFLLTQTRSAARVAGFLGRLWALYAIGIAIFAVFPVNGPSLYYPEQQDLTRSLPSTVALATGMLNDYQAVRTGAALSGFGYFIAVPSLHVLVAIFLQHRLASYPVLFRAFLPINILVALSTVALGYHYVFDVVAAVAVYAACVLAAGYPGEMDEPSRPANAPTPLAGTTRLAERPRDADERTPDDAAPRVALERTGQVRQIHRASHHGIEGPPA